jgi:hypothetical protein
MSVSTLYDYGTHVLNVTCGNVNDSISLWRQRTYDQGFHADDVFVNGYNVTHAIKDVSVYPGPTLTINISGSGYGSITLYDDRDPYISLNTVNVYGGGGTNSLTLIHQGVNSGYGVSSSQVLGNGNVITYWNIATVQVNAPGGGNGIAVNSAPNPGTQFIFVGGSAGTDGLRIADPNASAYLNVTGKSSNTPGYNGYWWFTNNSSVSFYNVGFLNNAGVTTDLHTAEFLQQTYSDLLGWNLDYGSLRYYTGQMNQGWSRAQVARSILSSAAYETELVQGYYTRYLGRQGSTGEVNFYVGLMQSGWTEEQVQTQFLASTEFYNRVGANLPSFVNAVYQIAWGRTAQQWEINGQVAWINSGASRATFVTAMLGDQNHWGYVVGTYYQGYLRRAAGSGEVSTWVATQQQRHLRDEDILADLIGSDEYFSRIANW